MLSRLLDDLVKHYCPQIDVVPRSAAMFPFARDPNFFGLPCAGNDWLLIGDTAGHADPITGEGLIYAFLSAQIAVQSIQEYGIEAYDRVWREEYGNRLRELCREGRFLRPCKIGFPNCSSFSEIGFVLQVQHDSMR